MTGITDTWFTVEIIDPQTYAISEYKHWEETHCYLLCGRERALLIDTGLGVSNIRTVVDQLTKLPILAAATHVHWDHIGGHRFFEQIAVHELEKEWISGQFPLPVQEVRKSLTMYPCDFPAGFDPEVYRIYQGFPQRVLRDGDRLDLGGREVRVIHTPGHSPGHCCFYEPERRYLYAGDLIYRGCLQAFYPSTDPLLFYESVKKIRAYQADRILPGHHQMQIPGSLVEKVADGFAQIKKNGLLRQGSGCFDFGEFQIQI